MTPAPHHHGEPYERPRPGETHWCEPIGARRASPAYECDICGPEDDK
jgi:hypothetical protein